ncbi:cation-translocating P-type ATPase [Pontixanthobacter gangjinensis]|uniref:cation-translocating P-type ATPase n=1 Tax=Pontixanthobacter gangjinensis TaxID=1028742 RepID=UPI00136DD2E7|nr:HAD-IC family P-type ATPase [Pontixanthobacter gangjinensis]
MSKKSAIPLEAPPIEGGWHAVDAIDALAKLGSAHSGLSHAEAEQRLATGGPNVLPHPNRVGPLAIFLRQFASPLIYLLVFAGVLSLAIGDRWDALFIFGVLLSNALVGSYQEFKADAGARALRDLVPQVARVRRDGMIQEIPAVEVVAGDIVELESGMKVTADLRLVDTHGLHIDESSLTGESMPVLKDAALVLDAETVAGDRRNIAHAGTIVVEGRGSGVVAATGGATLLAGIGSMLSDSARSAVETPLVRRMARLARRIALATVSLILVLALLLALQGEGWRDIVLLAIALAVAAIPEGLPIAVTVALSAAASRMADRNVIVRALPAVEGLGSCTLIATDKTGTLTLNRLTVNRVMLPDGTAVNRDQWLDGSRRKILAEIGSAAAICNEAHLTDTGSPVGDAVDIALLDLAHETGNDPEELLGIERLAIVPYEPVAKFAAVEADLPDGSRLVVKGAPETVLAMCSDLPDDALELAEQIARDGYRVLVLADARSSCSSGPISSRLHGLRLLGFVGLSDPLRFGVVEAIAKCREAGISVRMITGDHPTTALAIARQLGLEERDEHVITGSDLARLQEGSQSFIEAVGKAEIFARIEPAQKLAIVTALQRSGHIVAVTGDGVNDGPALHAADIGVAMGKGGTDVARAASDLVIADDNFATILAGIEEGRVTFLNIRKIVIFMLATGLAEILMFIAALSAGLPMPLTPVQLLWLNLVTNGLQDVTLGFGKGEGDELRQVPRSKLSALIDRDALVLMLPGTLVMTLVAVWMMAEHLAAGESVDEARNAVLFLVVIFQNAFLLSVRNLHLPFWRWHPPENGWLFAGLSMALLLHLAAQQLPLTQHLLGVSPIGIDVAMQSLAAALAVLLATEAAKWWLGRRAPAPANGTLLME